MSEDMIEIGSANKELRFRIPEKLWIRYQVLLLGNKLSLAKQTTELIRKFVEIHEINVETMKRLRLK